MKFVEPIRDISKINTIKKILKADQNYRDLLLFVSGINFALRIWDLLTLKTKDLINEDGSYKDFFYIQETKTSKNTKRTVTDSVKDILDLYIDSYPNIVADKDNYLFFRQKQSSMGQSHISRRAGLDIIKGVTSQVGLQWNYGSHSLRKTWWYQARKADIPLEIIQHKLNHSSLRITERYLGITAEEVENADNLLNL